MFKIPWLSSEKALMLNTILSKRSTKVMWQMLIRIKWGQSSQILLSRPRFRELKAIVLFRNWIQFRPMRVNLVRITQSYQTTVREVCSWTKLECIISSLHLTISSVASPRSTVAISGSILGIALRTRMMFTTRGWLTIQMRKSFIAVVRRLLRKVEGRMWSLESILLVLSPR